MPLMPGAWLLKSEKLIPLQTTMSLCTGASGSRMLPVGNENDVPDPVGQYCEGTVPFGEKTTRRRFAVALGPEAYASRSPKLRSAGPRRRESPRPIERSRREIFMGPRGCWAREEEARPRGVGSNKSAIHPRLSVIRARPHDAIVAGAEPFRSARASLGTCEVALR
jgi:hypothetical protein